MKLQNFKSTKATLAFVLFFLLLLSLRSEFSIYDVESMNWDIALMLSPWGFFHNLILESNHYLAPYYEHSVARGSLLKDPVFALILTGIIALAFWGLKKVARHEA